MIIKRKIEMGSRSAHGGCDGDLGVGVNDFILC